MLASLGSTWFSLGVAGVAGPGGVAGATSGTAAAGGSAATSDSAAGGGAGSGAGGEGGAGGAGCADARLDVKLAASSNDQDPRTRMAATIARDPRSRN